MSWVLVVLGFAALVILHEAGHFAVAKATGMRVERFFLFFPPKLVSFKRGETEYGIGMIPLGGFVKITGMNPEELEAAEAASGTGGPEARRAELATAMDAGRDTPQGLLERVEASGQDPSEQEIMTPDVIKRAYYNQPVWKRVAVIAAGPAVNIAIAFILLTIVYLNVREPIGFQVDKVESGTPAAKVLQPGDRLISIDGVPARIHDVNSIAKVKRRLKIADYKNRHLSRQIGSHKCAGTPTPGCTPTSHVRLKIARDGKVLVVHPRTFYDAQRKRFRLGFQFGTLGTQTAHQSVSQAANLAADRMWQVTSQTVSKIAQLFNAQDRKQLSGVVGTSSALNQAIDFSPRIALYVLALISLSLGVINLFPFLPLDGGHIFWSLVEKVRGQRVPFAWMERASAIGFLLVIMLFVIGLTNDIGRLSS